MDNQQDGGLEGPWRNPPKGGPWELFFVENMRRLREKAKMTQTDLAKALKARGLPFHQPTIQRVENGERPVRLNEAFAIAEELDCDLETMTSHLISKQEDIRLEIERLARRSTPMIEALLEEYGAYLEGLAEFAGSVWDSLPDWPKDEHGEPTTTAAEHFRSLDYNAKAGLAILSRVNKLGFEFEGVIRNLAEFFGDRNKESRPDVWEWEFPDDEVLRDVDSLLFEMDCEELQQLRAQSLTALYVTVINRTRKWTDAAGLERWIQGLQERRAALISELNERDSETEVHTVRDREGKLRDVEARLREAEQQLTQLRDGTREA